VNGARILDVTTIRDLHTGLPRGTYGFVVRGQRHPLPSSSSSSSSLQPQQQHQASQISTVDKTNPLQSITKSKSHDGMTDSFVFADEEEEVVARTGGTVQDSNAPAAPAAAAAAAAMMVPIRDYLCAVPTLEEAQMWVVALQWAASIQNPHYSDEESSSKSQPPSDTVSTTKAFTSNIPLPMVTDHHWWKVDYTNTASAGSSNAIGNRNTLSASLDQSIQATPTKTSKAEILTSTNDAEHKANAGALGVDSDTTNTLITDPAISSDFKTIESHSDPMANEVSGGKILVTAVTGYSVVRCTTWTLEIVYHIHAMLLGNDTKTTGNTASADFIERNVPLIQQQQQQQQLKIPPSQRSVEHWSLQRTADQFQAVAAELFRTHHHSSSSSSCDDNVNTSKSITTNDDEALLRRLPTWSSRPTIVEVDQSVSIVDSILRSWILSPQIVNTDVLKQFLGTGDVDSKVNNNNNNSSGSSNSTYESVGAASFLSFVRNVHCTHPLAIRNKSVTTVPNHMTSDIYVREWLQLVRRTGMQQRISSVTNSKNNNKSGGTTIGLLSLLFKTKPTTMSISQIAIQLHHHQYHERNMLYFGGAAVAVIGMIPSVVPLWRYIMPVIQIRFDYLIASWVGATYIGHRIGLASARSDRGGISNHHRLGGIVPVTSRQKKFGTAAAPSTSLKSITTNTVDQQHGGRQVPDSPKPASSSDNSVVMVTDYVDAVHSSDMDDFADFHPAAAEPFFRNQHEQNIADDGNVNVDDDDESDGEATTFASDDILQRPVGDKFLSSLSNDENGRNNDDYLSSPLPKYPNNNGSSCWSQPSHDIFHVRGATYLRDKIKVCSGPSPLTCRGVDVWITDNPERHIARHPSILGGRLNDVDTFLVNFLLPFGNLVAYFEVPPLSSFPSKLRTVWTKFLKGDQQYRDARLKLLPVVVDGPWIVKTAVGPGKSPALLGKAIPLQYFFRDPDGRSRKGIYEVDVIITASTIAKGILSVVKSQTKAVSIAFAFIIEAVEQSELPETVLCSFQVHSLHLEECPSLPQCNLE
jgi:hypothetical protein